MLRNFLSVFFFFTASFCFSQEPTATDCKITFNGTYSGKNLYFQNPFIDKKKGLCVTSITLNDSAWKFVNASVIEVDLKSTALRNGDSIAITIFHQCDCKPKILNPSHHYPRKLNLSYRIEGDSLLTFRLQNKEQHSQYVLQQFRWNKWVAMDSVKEKKNTDTSSYRLNLKRYLHSGENRFRIATADIGASPIIIINSSDSAFKMPTEFEGDKIYFLKETCYEIWDELGRMLQRGCGKEADISALYKGKFYLNYGNTSASFLKK
jgi:hypothetical protein